MSCPSKTLLFDTNGAQRVLCNRARGGNAGRPAVGGLCGRANHGRGQPRGRIPAVGLVSRPGGPADCRNFG